MSADPFEGIAYEVPGEDELARNPVPAPPEAVDSGQAGPPDPFEGVAYETRSPEAEVVDLARSAGAPAAALWEAEAGEAPPAPEEPALPFSLDVATTLGEAEAQRALDTAWRLGIPPDVAARNLEASARILRERALPVGELARSRALRAFFGDPHRAAAAWSHAQDLLDLRRQLAAEPVGELVAGRFELGQGAVRQGELVYRRIFGELGEAEGREWDALKLARAKEGERQAARAGAGAPEEAPAHTDLAPDEVAAFAAIQEQLDALAPETEVHRTIGAAAEQLPIWFSGGAGAITGGVVGAALPATVAVGASLLGRPEVAAVATKLVGPAAKAGAAVGGGEAIFRANLGESYAALEDLETDQGEPLPREAVVGVAVLAAAAKTGLDLVSIAATLELVGGAAVFQGPLAGLRQRLTGAISEPAVRALAAFGARYLTAVGSEYATEGLQELVDAAGQEAAVALSSGEGVGGAARRTWAAVRQAVPEAQHAGAEAARATALLGGLGAAGQAIVLGAQRIRRAEQEAKRVAALNAALGRLQKLVEATPEQGRQVIQALGDEAGQPDVFMYPKDVPRAVFEQLPLATIRELRAALREQRPAAIPLGVYATVIAPALEAQAAPPGDGKAAAGGGEGAAGAGPPSPETPATEGDAAQPAETEGDAAPAAEERPAPPVMLSEDSYTPEELESLLATADAEVSAREAALGEAADADRVREAGIFGQGVRDQLLAAGRPEAEAVGAAAIVRQAVLTLARKRGIPVAEALRLLPRLRFQGPERSGLPLERPDLVDAPIVDVAKERRRAALLAAVADLRNPEAASAAERKGAKYPVLRMLWRLGGVDPESPLAGELRNMGVTHRTMPGIWKRGGLAAADNIPASEWPYFAGQLDVIATGTDESGYFDERALLDAVREELAGRPIEPVEVLEGRAERERARDELLAALEDAGVDLETASDDEAVEALLQAEARLVDELFQPARDDEAGRARRAAARRAMEQAEARFFAAGGTPEAAAARADVAGREWWVERLGEPVVLDDEVFSRPVAQLLLDLLDATDADERVELESTLEARAFNEAENAVAELLGELRGDVARALGLAREQQAERIAQQRSEVAEATAQGEERAVGEERLLLAYEQRVAEHLADFREADFAYREDPAAARTLYHPKRPPKGPEQGGLDFGGPSHEERVKLAKFAVSEEARFLRRLLRSLRGGYSFASAEEIARDLIGGAPVSAERVAELLERLEADGWVTRAWQAKAGEAAVARFRATERAKLWAQPQDAAPSGLAPRAEQQGFDFGGTPAPRRPAPEARGEEPRRPAAPEVLPGQQGLFGQAEPKAAEKSDRIAAWLAETWAREDAAEAARRGVPDVRRRLILPEQLVAAIRAAKAGRARSTAGDSTFLQILGWEATDPTGPYAPPEERPAGYLDVVMVTQPRLFESEEDGRRRVQVEVLTQGGELRMLDLERVSQVVADPFEDEEGYAAAPEPTGVIEEAEDGTLSRPPPAPEFAVGDFVRLAAGEVARVVHVGRSDATLIDTVRGTVERGFVRLLVEYPDGERTVTRYVDPRDVERAEAPAAVMARPEAVAEPSAEPAAGAAPEGNALGRAVAEAERRREAARRAEQEERARFVAAARKAAKWSAEKLYRKQEPADVFGLVYGPQELRDRPMKGSQVWVQHGNRAVRRVVADWPLKVDDGRWRVRVAWREPGAPEADESGWLTSHVDLHQVLGPAREEPSWDFAALEREEAAEAAFSELVNLDDEAREGLEVAREALARGDLAQARLALAQAQALAEGARAISGAQAGQSGTAAGSGY